MVRLFLSLLLPLGVLLSCSGDQGRQLNSPDNDDSNLPVRISSGTNIYATVCGCPTEVNQWETHIITACIWEGAPGGGPVIPGASISISFLYDGIYEHYNTSEKITDANGRAQWSVWFKFGPGHYTPVAVGRTAENEFFYDYNPNKWMYINWAPRPPGMSTNEAAKKQGAKPYKMRE